MADGESWLSLPWAAFPQIWPLETRVVEAIGARFCSNNSGFQAPFVAKVGFQTKFSFSTSTHPWQMGNHDFHCLGQPFPNFAAGKLSCFYENWGKLFPNFIFRRSVCRASLRQKCRKRRNNNCWSTFDDEWPTMVCNDRRIKEAWNSKVVPCYSFLVFLHHL